MPPRILVVDDEPDIAASLASYLEGSMGAEVVRASSGAEALAAMEKHAFDLVVSDYRMPGMNGIELLARFRRDRPDVPRVLLTAYPDMDLAIRAVNEASIAHFLTKPVEPNQLLAAAQASLEQSRRERLARQALQRAVGHGGGKAS